MRRACVEFRVNVCRDTGVNLTAADCQGLLGLTLKIADSGGEVSLRGNPGLFYTLLGVSIMGLKLPLDIPDHLMMKVAWYCQREAAEVHKHPAGMGRLGNLYYRGRGVTATVWTQKAPDLGNTIAKAALGAVFLNGDLRGLAKGHGARVRTRVRGVRRRL